MALAASSLRKRSVFTSQLSGRPSFIAIQLTMHAVLARCATGAGASGCARDFTHSSQFLWCERLWGNCTASEALGSISFALLASSGFSEVFTPVGSLEVAADSVSRVQ